jgi:hypothetical protein
MTNWPIFLMDQVTVPSGLSAADFTVYTRVDDMRQSAFKGHPLIPSLSRARATRGTRSSASSGESAPARCAGPGSSR